MRPRPHGVGNEGEGVVCFVHLPAQVRYPRSHDLKVASLRAALGLAALSADTRAS